MFLKVMLLVIFYLTGNAYYSQIDTLELKNQVLSIKSNKDHIDFFKQIYRRDQGFRGDEANIKLDLKNLILVSYYINEHGYPKAKFQANGDIIPYVWIHNWIDEIDVIAFPLIELALQNNAIEFADFRDNYLSALYKSKYDNNRFDSLSNLEIMGILKVPRDDKIDISKILDTYYEYQKLHNSLLETVGLWATKESSREVPFEDGFLKVKVEMNFIEIKELNDDYYIRGYSEYWKEDTYKKLIKLNNSKNSFVKNSTDTCNYTVDDEEYLIYKCSHNESEIKYYRQ